MYASALQHPRCTRPVRIPAALPLRTGLPARNRYSGERPWRRRCVGARADSKSDGTKAAGNAQPGQQRWDFMGWLDGLLHPQGVPVALARGARPTRTPMPDVVGCVAAHARGHGLQLCNSTTLSSEAVPCSRAELAAELAAVALAHPAHLATMLGSVALLPASLPLPVCAFAWPPLHLVVRLCRGQAYGG